MERSLFAQMSAASPATGNSTRALDVLIVDDDPLILTVVDLMVRHAGHTARTACDGPAALDVLADATADIIVSDIRMPGMDGLELARLVRKDYPQIPIILMTGYLSEYSSGSASEIGVDGILKKPFKSTDLIAAISRAVPA
jgi:CheY-like chemotaxis protein